MEKATGVIIKKLPLSDTSLIVVWCTEQHGLVRTAAKGARRPGSPFAGRLDLFYQAELALVRARMGDLHTLREVRVLDFRPQVSSSYLRVLAGSYFVKLVEQASEAEAPIPEKYALLTRALDWLNAQEPTLRGVLHFEKELATCLGLWGPGHPVAPAKVLEEVCHGLPERRGPLLERLTPDGS
jgi:DNA repair protein RecO (recombination protein O)